MRKYKKSILIIGPFPEPIHGMSLANEKLFTNLQNDKVAVSRFDTKLSKVIKKKSTQGKMSFTSFIASIIQAIKLLLLILLKRPCVLYITPPQSSLGFLRFLPVYILGKVISKKVLVHIHGSKLASNINSSSFIIRKLFKLAVCFIDKFIFLGDSISRKHQQVIGMDKHSIVANGVEIPDMKYLAEKFAAEGETNILFLSNLMKDKGIIDFLDSLKDERMNSFIFHIAGAIEPDLEGEIDIRLKKLGSHVIYYGLVSGKEKHDLLLNADIFVLPTYDEGQPLSILEAYSYGCAVVTTCVGGIPDIFTDRVNGVYCEVASPESIVNSILSLKDFHIRKEIAVNNYQLCTKNYSDDSFISNLKLLFIS